MAIYNDPETRQITVDFEGGDIVAGLCADEDGAIDSVGIAEAQSCGISGEEASDDASGAPSILLRFHTRAALESFIGVLLDYKAERFGEEGR